MSDELDQQCINTIRFLSVDMVQKVNSGQPTCFGRVGSNTARAIRIGLIGTASCVMTDSGMRHESKMFGYAGSISGTSSRATPIRLSAMP